MRSKTIAAALLVVAATAPALARETIVGRWGETREVCAGANALDIEPMGLAAEEMSCDFTEVSRVEDVVTWKGTCFVREEPPRRETVVATLAADRTLKVHFRGSGSKIGPLQRCR